MLNLKFVILKFIHVKLTSLTASIAVSRQKQALKCKEKQLEVFSKASVAVQEEKILVEVDTIVLEQARTEAIARVNMEYDRKIDALEARVDKAREYVYKQSEKIAIYARELHTSPGVRD